MMDEMVLEKQATKALLGFHGHKYLDKAGRLIEIHAIDELLRLIVDETGHCQKAREALQRAENQIQEAEYWAKRHQLDVLASESRLIALGRILNEYGMRQLTMSHEGA